jgi:GT2 family glycosyltransferase
VPRVSVIVPIFNGVAFLPAFFESLTAALPDDSELILVDDGSSEPVWETVPEFAHATSVARLRNETNLGYSVAVNRAFGVATGEIVVQLNTDLILEPECIRAMIDLIAREERVGIVGSKLVFPTTGLVEHIGMAFGNYTRPKIFFELPAAHPLCGRTRELQIMTGATVAMTRNVLDRLGPLDEEYFNQNEDIEHCLLALRHGLRNFVCAESVAYHWKSRSGPARFARRPAGEALLWSRWGREYEVDLGRFVDEALDHALADDPHLESIPFEVLDLSRGADQPIVLDRISRRWPGAQERVRRFPQMNNPSERLWLPLLVPHWTVRQSTPFIYLVDAYRELEENALWFESRSRLVTNELIVDLKGAVVRTSDMRAR